MIFRNCLMILQKNFCARNELDFLYPHHIYRMNSQYQGSNNYWTKKEKIVREREGGEREREIDRKYTREWERERV